MTTARALALIVAAALFLAGYAIRASQSPSSASSVAALEHRIDKLEQRLALSRDDPQSLSFSEDVAQQSGAPAPASRRAMPVDAGSGMGRRPMSAAEIARGRAARITDLDASFRKDPMDPAGASRAEGELAEAAAADDLIESGITPIAIDTQCHSTRCRIITRFPANSDAEAWAGLYVLSAANTLASADTVATPRPDGTIELAIYGIRK